MQSLSPASSAPATPPQPKDPEGSTAWKGRYVGRRGYGVQTDFRNDDVAVEERTLGDYIRPPRWERKGRRRASGGGGGLVVMVDGKGSGGPVPTGEKTGSAPRLQTDTTRTAQAQAQAQLETEFPHLDTALIAAIASDHADAEQVRTVLRALG